MLLDYGRRIGVSACCVVLLASSTAHTAAPKKGGPDTPKVSLQIAPTEQFAVELPVGVCVLDSKRGGHERILVTGFQRYFESRAKLLVVFAECRALNALRTGAHSPGLNHWGGAAAALINGKVQPFSGITRLQAIEELAGVFAKEETDDDVRAQDKDANRTIESMLQEAKSKAAVSVNYQKSLGLLAKDDIAAFSGTLMKETVNGKSRMVSGVWGMTLVRGYLVLVSIWRPFVDRSTLDILLSETRAALLSMILLNDKESFRAP